MYYNTFGVEFGCHACRNVTPNSVFGYHTKEKLVLSPQRVKLFIDPEDLTCPACGEIGRCEIFSVEFEDYIYDFQNSSPNSGVIRLEGSKRNGEIKEINMKSTSEKFSLTDYLNSIKYFMWYLDELKENRGSNNREVGEFFFQAYYSKEDIPLILESESLEGNGEIVAGTGGVDGFTYEIVREKMTHIRRNLEDKFNQRMS